MFSVCSFCDRYAMRTSPGCSTSLHPMILNVQSCLDVRLYSYRDDFAPTHSVGQQEMIPVQLRQGAVVLKIVTRLAWEHISNVIYLPGHFQLLPLPFYYSICAPVISNVLQLIMYITNYITEHCGIISNSPIYNERSKTIKMHHYCCLIPTGTGHLIRVLCFP